MTQDEKQQYLEFAKKIAKDAGKIMRDRLQPENVNSTKNDHSIVTLADTEINKMVINQVRQQHPSHGVLGEEESFAGEGEYVWVCDPIDGTKMYAHNIPVSMFSLALVHDGQPTVSVAYNPWVDDLYEAQQGGGSYKNGHKIHVASRPVGLDDKNAIGNWREFYTATMQKILQGGNWDVIPQYAIVIKGCLVAEGYLNGQIYSSDGAHDIAAVKLIIEEAGGKVTGLDGNEQRYDQPINGAVMSNGLIHDELLKLVRQDENPRD